MDITKQSPRASVAHQRFLFTKEKTCIDCHKGIAHQLPDMRGVRAGSKLRSRHTARRARRADDVRHAEF